MTDDSADSSIPLIVEPTPAHLTLLFKHAKSTIVLSVLPTQQWTEIKRHLLEVLQSCGTSTFPDTSTSLPSDPNDLEFGLLRDRKDYRKGWQSIEGKPISEVKAGKKRAGTKQAGPATTPGDLEVRDGSAIAYRLKIKHDKEDDEDGMAVEEETARSGWNVVIPDYDDEAEEEEIELDIPIHSTPDRAVR